MKILIINGHPYRKKNLSELLSENYAKLKKKEGHEVKILKLVDLKFDFISEDIYSRELETDLKKAQKNIYWADHLVFFYPLWWGEMPSLLKSFLERTLIPGFAFKYVNGKPKKLLKGKSAQFFCTAGGNKFYTSSIGKIDQIRTLGKILFFCGIKIKKIKIFPSIHKDLKKERIDYIFKKLK